MSKLTHYAVGLGYTLTPGSKHWKLRHSRSGYLTTLPFGTKFSPRSERNILSRLRHGARLKGGIA